MRSNAIPPALPAEFEDLLSASGRCVLAGTHALCGALANPRMRFLSRDDLLDRAKAERVRRVLEASLVDCLEPIERPIRTPVKKSTASVSIFCRPPRP